MARATKVASALVGSRSVMLLGPDIEHRLSLMEMLDGHAQLAGWLPDSWSFLRDRAARSRSPWARALDQFRGTSNVDYLDAVKAELDAADPEILIAYWGTIALGDLIAIKHRRPQLKIALMVLCHPLSVGRIGIVRQNLYMRNALKSIDGMIFPSVEMEAYFCRGLFRGRSAPETVVISPCWPENFLAGKPPEQVQPGPNLIYTGRTDLSARTIHPGDDIRDLMRGILESGVRLHHVRSPETEDGHPMRCPFPPLSIREFVAFMGGFDASLIAYNTDVCPHPERFHLTVPDRLITSVCAGIPIAIPAQGYSAAKAYLKDYPAVIEFESPSSLSVALSDRGRIAELRAAAWESCTRYTAKRHSATLAAFLDRIVR